MPTLSCWHALSSSQRICFFFLRTARLNAGVAVRNALPISTQNRPAVTRTWRQRRFNTSYCVWCCRVLQKSGAYAVHSFIIYFSLFENEREEKTKKKLEKAKMNSIQWCTRIWVRSSEQEREKEELLFLHRFNATAAAATTMTTYDRMSEWVWNDDRVSCSNENPYF